MHLSGASSYLKQHIVTWQNTTTASTLSKAQVIAARVLQQTKSRRVDIVKTAFGQTCLPSGHSGVLSSMSQATTPTVLQPMGRCFS